MARIADRATSRYAQEALRLFGSLIRAARIERGMTIVEMAERAGVSRGLLHRLESGHPGASLGVAFEVAAILGIPLFDADQPIARTLNQAEARLQVLPKSVRRPTREARDDF